MRRTIFLALGPIGLLVLAASAAWGQSGGPYDLTWSTVDGGGATPLAGGQFSLGGTAGQPDAGALHGGPLAVLGGFWESESFAVGVDDDPPAEALAFRLRAGVPNPFNPNTRLDFDLPSPRQVRLVVYDLRGARVRVLEDGFEYDGQPYGSLTAVARAVTGSHWNGRAFFGLKRAAS